MQMQQLIYLMKMADLRSMNKAAEALLMMQSDLSRAIINLEAELNIKLFKRNSKGMVMTEDDEELYQYSRIVLNRMDLIKGMALREIVPVLSIASYPLMSISGLSCEVYNNHKDESLRIQLLERKLQHIIEIMESGEAELGFLMHNDVQSREIKYMFRYEHIELDYLGTDTWYVNVGPHSLLYNGEEAKTSELLLYPIIGTPNDYFFNLTFCLSIDGISSTKFRKVKYMSDNAAMIDLLKYTDIFRFGPGISREGFAMHEIKTIPIKNCEVDIDVAWTRRKKEILGVAAREFVQMLEL